MLVSRLRCPPLPSLARLTRRSFSTGGGSQCDFAVIGCGSPGRGMGWFHARQILSGETPSARLTDVVEPWFLGAGMHSTGYPEFVAFKEAAEATGVRFHSAVQDMPAGPQVALIAGRAPDCPALFEASIDKGCTHVYLEKPGAPDVAAMQRMSDMAGAKGVAVTVGYNKNVAPYVTQALAFETASPGGLTTFVHNNDYDPQDLDECFERNAEGMLKNMAVHELALAVTYYGVRADNITVAQADSNFSVCETRRGFTDFAKVAFTLTTDEGKSLRIEADRCGGTNSIARNTDMKGNVCFETEMPDSALKARVETQLATQPSIMPYFFVQAADYIVLKEGVAQHVLAGKTGTPTGFATLEIAMETMKVAEYLTPLLMEQLQSETH